MLRDGLVMGRARGETKEVEGSLVSNKRRWNGRTGAHGHMHLYTIMIIVNIVVTFFFFSLLAVLCSPSTHTHTHLSPTSTSHVTWKCEPWASRWEVCRSGACTGFERHPR